MDTKKLAGRYLLSVAALFVGGFLIAWIISYAFVSKGMTDLSLTTGQLVLMALGLACLPAGTYTGFVTAGLKLIEKNEPSKGVMIAVCVFFPITLTLLTAFGIIMIVPTVVKYAVLLWKNRNKE